MALAQSSVDLDIVAEVMPPPMLAGLLISMGSLGDRKGHRKLLLIGSLGFTLVSVMTAYSSTATQLVVGRACMGVFGAMLMPSTLALIRSVFEDRRSVAWPWRSGQPP